MSKQYYTIALKKICRFFYGYLIIQKIHKHKFLQEGKTNLQEQQKQKQKQKQKKMHKFSFFSVQLKTPVFIHLCYQGEEKCHYHGYLFQTAFVTINITHLIEKEL